VGSTGGKAVGSSVAKDGEISKGSALGLAELTLVTLFTLDLPAAPAFSARWLNFQSGADWVGAGGGEPVSLRAPFSELLMRENPAHL